MKEIIADMREIPAEGGEFFADLPARMQIESALLDRPGQVVRVRITTCKGYATKPKNDKRGNR